MILAFLVAATVSGDFGATEAATLWRSALDEMACSREEGETGRQDGSACKLAHLYSIPSGEKVTILSDNRGLCSSHRAKFTRIRYRKANIEVIGCVLSESLR